jgi:hypothetical protein
MSSRGETFCDVFVYACSSTAELTFLSAWSSWKILTVSRKINRCRSFTRFCRATKQPNIIKNTFRGNIVSWILRLIQISRQHREFSDWPQDWPALQLDYLIDTLANRELTFGYSANAIEKFSFHDLEVFIFEHTQIFVAVQTGPNPQLHLRRWPLTYRHAEVIEPNPTVLLLKDRWTSCGENGDAKQVAGHKCEEINGKRRCCWSIEAIWIYR